MSSRQQTLRALSELICEKYEVLRWIGGGGMADVFLARHRVHGGKVAVKVLAESFADDTSIVARFLDEARTAARLSGHPNIVPIYDVGEGDIARGQPGKRRSLHYLIMQYVAGEDLGRYLGRQGILATADAVHIGVQIADALMWAARHGVVHRDLKPANIRLDLYGRAIVLDFGIAKARDQNADRTMVGERLGTPYYMSPEQIYGHACDERSDLYSLGIVLYQLVTGRRPFEGDSVQIIQDGHLAGTPLSPKELNSSVDPAFSGIIERLMAKDPTDRYQTAAELLFALRAMGTTQASLHPEADDTSDGGEFGNSVIGNIAPAKTNSNQLSPSRKGAVWTWVLVSIGLLVLLIVGIYLTADVSPPHHDFKVEVKTPPVKKEFPNTVADDKGIMVLVPAGEFLFGSDAPDAPYRAEKINLAAYYVDTTEVPNRIYEQFCEATGHRLPDNPEAARGLEYPVLGITLEDAQAFAKWAGKRLPTEQEWEKAARGTDGRVYPWGNETLGSPNELQPVNAFPERQSPYGALNMVGNAWEWTLTPFPVTEREIADLKSVLGLKSFSREWYTIKGGSFQQNQERFRKAFMRRGWPKDTISRGISFRCVRDPKST